MNLKKLLTTALFSAILLASSSIFAQVKIGTNPTTIDANNHLEVEGSAGNKVFIKKTGKVTIADGSQGAGKVLTSDASGEATWQTQSVGCASFEASRSSQTVPINNAITDPYTLLVANNESYDPANAYNNATGEYTVPVTGFYAFKVSGGDVIQGVTNAARYTSLLINSQNKGALSGVVLAGTLYTDGTYNSTSSFNYLTAGDVITFRQATVHTSGPKPAQTVPFTSINFSGTRIDCNKN